MEMMDTQITAATTLGELLVMLNLGDKPKTPTPKALFKEDKPIAIISDCTLFRNGFAIYKNDTGRTIVWLPHCTNFTFYFNKLKDSEKDTLKERMNFCMTETKNTAKLPEPIPVDTKKLIDGLGTIFSGVIQLLAAMEPNMAKELADMAINGVPKEKAPETFNPDDFEEIIAADDLPWDTEPEQPKPEEKPKPKKDQSTLTVDDLIKVVTQKIKKDRSNKDKVLALLKSYGAAKVSDVPADKYEAFLTDLSQL